MTRSLVRHVGALLIAAGGLYAGGAGCGGAPARPVEVVAAGSGDAAPAPPPPAHDPRCDAVRPKIEQLYRAEAEAREPKRIDAAVADNTTMVLNDCVKAPDKIAPCITAVATAQELEAKCLAPLDDEGSEGDTAAR